MAPAVVSGIFLGGFEFSHLSNLCGLCITYSAASHLGECELDVPFKEREVTNMNENIPII